MKVKLHFCDGNEISTSERRPAPGATGGPTRGSIGVDRRNERSKDARRVRRERDQRRRAKGAKEGEGGGGDGAGWVGGKRKPEHGPFPSTDAAGRRLAKDLSASATLPPSCLSLSPFLSLSLSLSPSLSLSLFLSLSVSLFYPSVSLPPRPFQD